MLKPEEYREIERELKEINGNIELLFGNQVQKFYSHLYRVHYDCVKEIPFDNEVEGKIRDCIQRTGEMKEKFICDMKGVSKYKGQFTDCLKETLSSSAENRKPKMENCISSLKQNLESIIKKATEANIKLISNS